MNATPGNAPQDLPALAERCGVATRYHNFRGEEIEVAGPVLRKVLSAMGVDPERALVGEPRPTLPAVKVVTQGQAASLHWQAGDAAPPAWSIVEDEAGSPEPVRQGIAVRLDREYVIELPSDLEPGYFRIVLAGEGSRHCLLVVAPEHCWVPAELEQGERWWGCTVQLYALRSSRNWGAGDFGDLSRLVEVVARHGAAFIGLNPLHALFPHRPAAASPYSPSSRTALNPFYLDVQSLVDRSGCRAATECVYAEAFQARLRHLREGELVDYAAVAAAKEEVLGLLWQHFEAKELKRNTPRAATFKAFMARRRETLGPHALFEALQAHFFAGDNRVWGWPAWPMPYRDSSAECVRAFEREHAAAVQYRFWLQWLTEQQLESVQRYARARGMALGLYCDLAVAPAEGGSETWMQPELYAWGMHVGAPPDDFNALGQDWGQPPLNPLGLESSRYRPFVDALRANMRHCGALRLDHVMSLMRLFWTTAEGGTYVRYPLEALLGILALESHRHQCMVIGEDLGNVAPGMKQAMQQRCLLSYRPLLFERTQHGHFRAPDQWQRQALAVVSTHDLPTLRGFWLGEDIELKARLQLYADEAVREQQVIDRAQDRARLLLALQHEKLLPGGATAQPPSVPDATPEFVEAVYAFLARTPAWLVGVQLEDLTGELVQVNVPGTTDDRFPNWRRKLAVAVDELPGAARFASVVAALRTQRSIQPRVGETLAELPALSTAEVPSSTYRVQFQPDCTFAQITCAVPYLHALGISHLYSSPYLRARPGSTHGYDIVDHSALNPEIGDAADHERLCETLRRHGMRQMLDVVPNHMGVLEADNAWWLDVLENGPASAHADTFDIEWHPADPEMAGRVLLPVLGDHYGRVLEAGEIQLKFHAESGEFWVHYFGHRFPIDPSHYRQIFDVRAAPPPRSEAETESRAVVASLLDALAMLPPRDVEDEVSRRTRLRDGAIHKKSLARLARRHGWLAEWISDCLRGLNGRPGEPASFDALDRLMACQAYRLADWRVASDDVNYRRFFDVNTLAGVRMEQPHVFDATHRLVLRWLQGGQLAALRIDHPDGLSDPQRYFERLQSHYAGAAAIQGREPQALYLVVEKILAEHEMLPDQWLVHGDTGYRFAGIVNGLFVDGSREQEMDRLYRSFTGTTENFNESAYRCKKLIISSSLFSELSWLANAVYRITRASRRTCDFTRSRLQAALAEVAASFPVYRTYLRTGEAAGAIDRQHLDWAIAAARRRLGSAEMAVLDHLRNVVLGEGEAAGADPAQHSRFVARWQQFTSPVMAKAVEDTAFYRFVRLASLNDVGSDPRRFGVSPAAFHAANQSRARFSPHTMLATSTHDSKRGEDLRARIDVLSEDPASWHESLQRLAGWADPLLTQTESGAAPSRNVVWLLFQTLAGLWPVAACGEPEREELRRRVQAYMLKAVREAKQDTSWTSPVPAYEDALAHYIDGILRPGDPNPFVQELDRLARRLAPFGFRNSLSQLALKLTAPGVPDIYQGCEQWNFSLVDPDNRRPVDFERLAVELAAVRSLYEGGWPSDTAWRELNREIANGPLKQLITWRLLQLRRSLPELFRDGAYLPLSTGGPAAEHAVAFARHREGQVVLVIAARLTCTLCSGDPDRWSAGAWRDTSVSLDAGQAAWNRSDRWQDWVTGRELESSEGGAASLALAQVLGGPSQLPFAVLVPAGTRPEG